MALKDWTRGDKPERQPLIAVAEEAPAQTYIDEGCELNGKLRFRESVRIDGRVQGEIEGEQTVTVGESGCIEASIDCESVVIYGRVEGDIAARRKITLHKSACVTGDMRTAGIVIEEGAKVEGRIVIGPAKTAPADAPKSTTAEPPKSGPPAPQKGTAPAASKGSAKS